MILTRILIILSLFAAVPLAQGTLVPSTNEEYWRKVNLILRDARPFFADDVCSKDDRALAACKAGLRAIDPKFVGPNLIGAAGFRFADQLESILKNYRGQESVSARLARAINAELKVFDPHARLTTVEQFDDQVLSADPIAVGIGIDFEMTAAGTILRRVYATSPAASAGLRVGDRILAVGDQTIGIGLSAPPGLKALSMATAEPLKLEISRGSQVLALKIKPAALRIPAVIVDKLDAPKTLHLILRNFGSGVCAEVGEALGKVRPHALILDLRGNLGGGLDEAYCLFKLFQDRGTFVTKTPLKADLLPAGLPLTKTFGQVEQNAWTELGGETSYPKLPLVILVNGASASAAEMLGAALQDTHRARVVGERTFGKGTTQGESVQAFNDEIILVYTVSRFFRPSGEALQDRGVVPDFVIPFNHLEPQGARTVWRERDWFGAFFGPEFSAAGSTAVKAEAPELKRLRLRIGTAYRHSPDEQLAFARALILL